jgi:hypothetical protein
VLTSLFYAIIFPVASWNGRGTGQLLGPGALPMVNVLAVGLWISLRRRGSSPFLLRFEVFGAAALALYLLVWIFYADAWMRFYLYRIINPLRKLAYDLEPRILNYKIFYLSVAAVVQGLPQIALALTGGFLFRRFRTAGRRGRTHS